MAHFVSSSSSADVLEATRAVMAMGGGGLSTSATITTTGALVGGLAVAAASASSSPSSSSSLLSYSTSTTPIIRRLLYALLALVIRKCLLNAATRIATIAATSAELKRLGLWPKELEGKEDDFRAIIRHIFKNEGIMGFLRAADADVFMTMPIMLAQRLGRAGGKGIHTAVEMLMGGSELDPLAINNLFARLFIRRPLAIIAAALPMGLSLPFAMIRLSVLTQLHTDMKSANEKKFYFHRYGGMRNCMRRLYRGGGRTMRSFFLSGDATPIDPAEASSPMGSPALRYSTDTPAKARAAAAGKRSSTETTASTLVMTPPSADHTVSEAFLLPSPASEESGGDAKTPSTNGATPSPASPLSTISTATQQHSGKIIAKTSSSSPLATLSKGVLVNLAAMVAWQAMYIGTSVVLRKVLTTAVLGAISVSTSSSASSAAAAAEIVVPSFDVASAMDVVVTGGFDTAAAVVAESVQMAENAATAVAPSSSSLVSPAVKVVRHVVAVLASIVATLATQPYEVVRCRMLMAARSAGNGGAVGEDSALLDKEYASVRECCQQIMREGAEAEADRKEKSKDPGSNGTATSSSSSASLLPPRYAGFYRGSRVAILALGYLSIGDLCLDAVLTSVLRGK